MLCREVTAVRPEIHKNYRNTLCGQNLVFFMLDLMVHKPAIGPCA